jgi:hypothetical protein
MSVCGAANRLSDMEQQRSLDLLLNMDLGHSGLGLATPHEEPPRGTDGRCRFGGVSAQSDLRFPATPTASPPRGKSDSSESTVWHAPRSEKESETIPTDSDL